MMASNVENSLCGILRTTEFSIQIDESSYLGNEALLLAYFMSALFKREIGLKKCSLLDRL